GRDLFGKVAAMARVADHVIDKTRYSAFAVTDLDLRLRERGIREVHLVGVCTDICVLHTAVDAYNLGYHIVVHADAVASFNATGHDWALTHFKQSIGAEVVGE
ncbi:MAG TPA: isochorismatase, partial [Exiguobacterium sp.]|nr:isochorismatase [Exiguobacterium sp.]